MTVIVPVRCMLLALDSDPYFWFGFVMLGIASEMQHAYVAYPQKNECILQMSISAMVFGVEVSRTRKKNEQLLSYGSKRMCEAARLWRNYENECPVSR